MPDVNSSSDFIQVATVDVFIDEQGDTKASTTSIGTDALGPCICFIVDFTYEQKQACVMQHYSYHDDETNKSQLEIVQWLLNFTKDLVMEFIVTTSTNIEFNEVDIHDMFLVVI